MVKWRNDWLLESWGTGCSCDQDTRRDDTSGNAWVGRSWKQSLQRHFNRRRWEVGDSVGGPGLDGSGYALMPTWDYRLADRPFWSSRGAIMPAYIMLFISRSSSCSHLLPARLYLHRLRYSVYLFSRKQWRYQASRAVFGDSFCYRSDMVSFFPINRSGNTWAVFGRRIQTKRCLPWVLIQIPEFAAVGILKVAFPISSIPLLPSQVEW